MVALVVGGIYGAATSLINDVSSPYGVIGGQIAGTRWQWAVEVTSKLVGVGWAWAALAVAVGWMAGASARRAAIAGVLALLAATTTYYGMDSILREEPFAGYWGEMLFFWMMSVVSGPALGVVGASIRRPGVIGLLAGLTVPVGATVEMIWLEPDPLVSDPALELARVIVWVAAAMGAGAFIARFIVHLRLG